MRLILLRHAETFANQQQIIQGQGPGQLTPWGHEQARRVAQRLGQESVDCTYASDLERVQETLAPWQAAVRVPLIVDPRLREKAFGIFEGRPAAEYFTDFGAGAKSIAEYCPPGGESFTQAYQRSVACLTEILGRSQSKQTVLLATHGGILRCFLKALFRLPWSAAVPARVDNAALSILDFNPENKLSSARINCRGHL